MALNGGARELGAIYVASLVVLLAVVAIARAAGLPWRRWLGIADERESMVSGVRHAVCNFMPYIA